jgi:hypothetical protein
MTKTEILAAQIARARAFFQQKTNLEYLASARDIIDASAHAGGFVTLNANQTRSLSIFLESEQALRETRALMQIHQGHEDTPTNILRFSRN